MTISLAQVYNSLRCHATGIFKFSADQLLINFQSITDSGSFFRRISVCFLLTQNLNYFGKAFFKDPMRVLLLALVEFIYLIVCLYSHIWYCFRTKYKNQKPPSWFWKDSKWKESGIFLKVLTFWYLHVLWFLANSYNGWIIKCLNFSKELHCTIYQFVKLLCKNKTLVFIFFIFLGQI